MAEGSGALLLRAGVVRPDQVQQATALRQRDGGSFGECLIRIGAITEDALVEFYHRRLMIPRINAAKLDHIPLKVIALVPADMAAEFRVIPVELDGEGNVTLAMADPSDNHAVDEVSFFLDRFVVRAVAAESGVRRAIERYYGVRFMSPRTDGQKLVEAPAHPTPTPAPAPAAPKKKERKELFEKPSREQLEEQIVLLTKVKHSDATPLPIPVPPPDDFEPSYASDEPPPAVAAAASIEEALQPLPPDEDTAEIPTLAEDDEISTTDPEIPAVGTPEQPILLTRPISQPEPEPRRKRSTLPGFPALAVPDPPLAELRAARDRDEIARAVLDYFGQLAGRVLFFVVRKSVLAGFDARGDIDDGSARQIQIALDAPSLFRDVVASRLPYRGPLPETVGNQGFANALGGVEGEVLLMPVAIRDRIVALVYADHTRQPLPSAALHACTREAGLAFERLILEAKGR